MVSEIVKVTEQISNNCAKYWQQNFPLSLTVIYVKFLSLIWSVIEALPYKKNKDPNVGSTLIIIGIDETTLQNH